MESRTWPAPEIAKAAEDVVMLAIHRNNNPEWATRLNVIAYPQFRYLDGYGRELDLQGGGLNSPRNVEDVVRAIEAAEGARISGFRPPKLPGELTNAVGADKVRQLESEDPVARLTAWETLVAESGLSPELLFQIFPDIPDAWVQLKAIQTLRKVAPQAAARLALLHAESVPSDTLRIEMLESIAAADPKAASGLLKKIVGLVNGGKSGWSNPNNVLCAATDAAAIVASLELIDPMTEVIAKEAPNNAAWFNAARALQAIGHRHGEDKVANFLRAAREEYDTYDGPKNGVLEFQ